MTRLSNLPAGLSLLLPDHLIEDLPRSEVEAAIRLRCHTVPIGDDKVLCRILGRYKFVVDGRDLGLAPHLMLDGYWEYWATTFIARRRLPGQVAFDVGANLGYYAVLMAELVGDGGRVVAVEPNPVMAALTERNSALNGFTARSRVHRNAASARSGDRLSFRVEVTDPKNGRLLPPGLAAAKSGVAQDITVTTTRLDDLAAGPVHFVKIDVEGAEEAVWAGMAGLLDRSPDITVLLEFNALRCAHPRDLLHRIAQRFPLRELRLDSQVLAVTTAEILPRQEDTLLVLTNLLI